MEYAVVIPARYESTRLPGKPLIELCGVPMVVRTYRRCALAVNADRIHVATDDDRIEEVCRSEGIQVIRTSSTCLTGTDRVAECARVLDVDTYLNVQGDEPVFEPADLSLLVDQARSRPDECSTDVVRLETMRSSMIVPYRKWSADPMGVCST